jgi:16S rRNA (guanine527-N7)-methyltransferase
MFSIRWRRCRTSELAACSTLAVAPDFRVSRWRSCRRRRISHCNHKKAAFLRQAVIELGLDNVDVVGERVEHWEPRKRFDVVISRAFSDVADLIKVAGRLCAPQGTLAAMKGVYPYEEIAQVPADFKLREVIPLKVPGLRAQRHLVLLEPARLAA